MRDVFKKILIVSPGILPVPDIKGGAVERLITMIADQNEVNYQCDITIATIREKEAIKKQRGYKNTSFLNYGRTKNSKIIELGSKIRWHLYHKFNVDFIIYDIYFFSLYLHILFNRKKYDMIIVEGDCIMKMRLISHLVGKDKVCAHLHCNREASNDIETVYGNILTVSNHILRTYRKSSHLPIERTITVFNGIETSTLKQTVSDKEKKQLRDSLGLKKSDFVVLFCGRIVPQKGVKELIEAIIRLNNPTIKLLILGSSNFGLGDVGSYPQHVKELVDKNQETIKFTGFISNSQIYKYHQISDIGVVPSTYEDPCPLSLFEMITSGLPTIATRAGGMPEIGNEETTLFIPLENISLQLSDGIKKLYQSIQLRKSMSSAALERSKIFESQRFVSDFFMSVNSLVQLNK